MSLATFFFIARSSPALAHRLRRSRRAVIVGEAAFRTFAQAVAFARTISGALVRRIGKGWAVSVPISRAAVGILAGHDVLAWTPIPAPSPREARAALIRANLPTMIEAHVLELAAAHLQWESKLTPHTAASEQIAHIEHALERNEYYPS